MKAHISSKKEPMTIDEDILLVDNKQRQQCYVLDIS